MGIFSKKRVTPEPVRPTIPDLRRPRRPRGDLDAWATEIEAYTVEAQERSVAMDSAVFPLCQRALADYFDAGDNDAAQRETLERMVSAGLRLGAGFAAVEKVLGIERSMSDPRVQEAMALATTPESTGMGLTASGVLSLCVDVGRLAAKVGDDGWVARHVLRETGDERALVVERSLRS